jgi:L-arabinokinase
MQRNDMTAGAAERPLAFYITSHGYGHGVRVCDIIRAFHRMAPRVPITVVTALPEAFLKSRLEGVEVRRREASFDVGIEQLDSIRHDVDASQARLRGLLDEWDGLVRQETDFIRSGGFGVVAADIPAIPLEAARAAGVPGIACGNFSWDWIYRHQTEGDPAVWRAAADRYEAVYRRCDGLIRMPFHGGMDHFPGIVDVGLLARPGSNRRAELAARTGAAPDRRWALLTFQSLRWEPGAMERLSRLREVEFFVVPPMSAEAPNVHAIDRSWMSYPDVLASADIVVSKPGFGIVSECVANRLPLVYTGRGEFAEYPVLVDAIGRYLKKAFITPEDLRAGRLGPALEAVLRCPEPAERMEGGGDEAAARRLKEFLVI